MTQARSTIPNLIGASPRFVRAIEHIQQFAPFDTPVLLSGETGTGKELAARAIHYLCPRSAAPFVPVNCGGLPDSLVESELFGHTRGAFTDARQASSGLVGAAQGGTLFLDEVDSLSPKGQAALLRFIQEGCYRPVGSQREVACDVRVLAAASPRLDSLIASGQFRPDLAFRLRVLEVDMPPLREREGDAVLLADYFARRYARRYDLAVPPIDSASRRWLASQAWPGNVRQLDNLVHRQTLLGGGQRLALMPETEVLPACEQHAQLSYAAARDAALCAWEREYLARLLRRAGGNVTRAAALAGKERRALGKLIKKHGIDRHGFVAA